MSENLFEDIGFDLVEKITPPSLPAKKIIETPSPAPVPELPSASPIGNKKGKNMGLIFLGVAVAAFVGYKIWENKRKKDTKKPIR